jgi:type VI secretion system protein ImpC
MQDIIATMVPAEPAGRPANQQVLQDVPADLDGTIGAHLDAILHHPELRRLEASWRGLKFFVDRTDFRANIQVEVLSLAKTSLQDAFSGTVFRTEAESSAEVPVAVIAAAYEFDRTADDLELLGEMARQVERRQGPLLASVGPTFLGLSSTEGLDRLPYMGTYFEHHNEPDDAVY